MFRACRPAAVVLSLGVGLLLAAPAPQGSHALAQEPLQFPQPAAPACAPPVPYSAPAPGLGDKPLPINLPAALRLSGARPIDIAVASARIRLAVAQFERAQVLWLPSILIGTDYFRHDGQIQDVAGNVFGTSKSSFMVGCAPIAVFALTDAIFGPLAARQEVRAREAVLLTAQNDSLLAVAEAYFNVQQARGELAGALDTEAKAGRLLRAVEDLAEGLAPGLEVNRARTEAARRRQAVQAARERWLTASADLVRLLRLDPSTVVEPLEPPHLQVTLVSLDHPVDDYIPVALTNRPELATQQALVQGTLQRLRQERLRPLIPSILLRGASTNPAGTLAAGLFGGGLNDNMGNFSMRSDFDVQVLWEMQNLGFGNRARVNERKAENRLAVLELFRTQDRVAAEVAQAYAQARSAAARVGESEAELRNAADTFAKSLEGMGQTRLASDVVLLVIRPQEVVAAVQALAQAYTDYYASVSDYDRAQFRLFHALGRPAQQVVESWPDCGDAALAPAAEQTSARYLPPPGPERGPVIQAGYEESRPANPPPACHPSGLPVGRTAPPGR
jgi:outer membrane protein TolC